MFPTVKNFATIKLVLDPPGTWSLKAEELPTQVQFRGRRTIVVTQTTGDKVESHDEFDLFLRLPIQDPFHPVARN